MTPGYLQDVHAIAESLRAIGRILAIGLLIGSLSLPGITLAIANRKGDRWERPGPRG